MDVTPQEDRSRVKTALILVFVAIDIIAVLLAAVSQIASILSRITH